MSLQAMVWALGRKCGGPAPKIVLLALANYADERASCWPSQTRLARECEMTPRSLRMQLVHLREIGLIRWDQQMRPNGSSTVNRYYLLMGGDLLGVSQDDPEPDVAVRPGQGVDAQCEKKLSTGSQIEPVGNADAQCASVDNPPQLVRLGEESVSGGVGNIFPPKKNQSFEPKDQDQNLGYLALDVTNDAREENLPTRNVDPVSDDRAVVQQIPQRDHQINPTPPIQQWQPRRDVPDASRYQQRRARWDERGSSVHDLPEIVSPWCRTHADDPSPRPCAACAAARAASDASRRLRSDAIDRARSAALRSSMAQAEREAVQVPAGTLRGMVHARIAVRRALSAPPDGMSEWM